MMVARVMLELSGVSHLFIYFFFCLLACFDNVPGYSSRALGSDESPCPLPQQLYFVLIEIMTGILAQMVGKNVVWGSPLSLQPPVVLSPSSAVTKGKAGIAV